MYVQAPDTNGFSPATVADALSAYFFPAGPNSFSAHAIWVANKFTTSYESTDKNVYVILTVQSVQSGPKADVYVAPDVSNGCYAGYSNDVAKSE